MKHFTLEECEASMKANDGNLKLDNDCYVEEFDLPNNLTVRGCVYA